MSVIRTFALATIAAAALSVSAQAQGQRQRAPNHGNRIGAFGNLNLTAAQKTQIKAIHTKYQAQEKASREQAKPYLEAARTARQKGDTAAFRSNMEKARQLSSGVRQQEMNDVRAILTPAQRAQADSAMAKARKGGAAWGAKRGGMKGAHGRKAGAFKTLNLTDAQKTQIKAIRAKYQGSAKTNRATEMNEIRSVLTADQRAKMDAAVAQRKQNRGDHGARKLKMKSGS